MRALESCRGASQQWYLFVLLSIFSLKQQNKLYAYSLTVFPFGSCLLILTNEQTNEHKNRYTDIPLISRIYLTGAFLTTAACSIDIITPFSLYFSWTLVLQGQVWRLISSYLYFGIFSVDFLFHMYFLVSSVCIVSWVLYSG